MFKIGVFALIFDQEDRTLLCHRRDYDLWNLPGGGLEERESPWEGVIREVKEETNLSVEIKRLSGIYFKPEKNELVLAFVCQIIGGEIRLTDEADRIDYFSLDKLPRNTPPKQVERIRDVLDGKKEVILKIQSGPSSVKVFKLKKR